MHGHGSGSSIEHVWIEPRILVHGLYMLSPLASLKKEGIAPLTVVSFVA